MSFTIDTSQLGNFALQMRGFGDEISAAIREGLEQAGETVQEAARERVHIDSGQLHDNIEALPPEVEGPLGAIEVGSDLIYAPIEEARVGGARYGGPHAFLEPAAAAKQAEVEADIAAPIAAALNRIHS